MRDKPFEILTKNRTANMTSVGWATQLVNELGVKENKSDPRLTKSQKQKKIYHSVKNFAKTFIQTAVTFIASIKLSTSFVF